MNFDVKKDVVCQSSHFKSRSDLVILGELEGGT